MQCPVCHISLTTHKNDRGIIWSCSKCKGCAAGIGLLQNLSDQKIIRQLWAQVEHKNQLGKRKCPDCVRKMHVVHGGPTVQNIELDVCSNCMFFWFDAEEMGKIPRISDDEVEKRNTESVLRNNANAHELDKMERLHDYVKLKTGRKEKFTQRVVDDAVATIVVSAFSIYLGADD